MGNNSNPSMGSLPLEGTEAAFKYIYQHDIPLDAVDLDSADIRRCFESGDDFGQYGGFQGIIRSMQKGDPIPLEKFFRDGQSIAILRHPRYMPAIPHVHDNFFEIQCVLTGEFSQSIGGLSVTLQTGDICFVAPNTLHSPFIVNDETIMVNILVRTEKLQNAFSSSMQELDVISEFCSRILYGKSFQPVLICRIGDTDSSALRLVREMMDQARSAGIYTDRLLYSMLEIFFIYLLRDHKEQFVAGRPLRKTEHSLLRIMQYMQENYARITLRSLAEHFNYSESYLSALIKSYYGRPFQALMTELRLKNAAKLLTSSSATVSEIVNAVGYTEKSHFFRVFKQQYGITPQEYRRLNKER